MTTNRQQIVNQIGKCARNACERELLQKYVSQLLLYHFIEDDYPITLDTLTDNSKAKIMSLHDMHSEDLSEDLRERAIDLVETYLGKKEKISNSSE